MANTSSRNAPPLPKLEELRQGYLPRLYLHRGLVRRMSMRLNYVRTLVDRFYSASGGASLYAAIDVLYNAYVLVEQMRKTYEIVASHVDVRFTGMRKSLDTRISNERAAEKQETYHERVWLYPLLDDVPDSAFTRLGLDVAHARAVLREITKRSAARRAGEEEELRSFAERYADVCNAYKHGRAVFATDPTVHMTGEKTGNLKMSSSGSVATVLLAESPALPPHAFLKLTIDAAFWIEVDRVFAIIETQLPRFDALVEGFVAMTEAAIDRLVSGGSLTDPLPTIPFFAFGEPYSDEEEQILDAIRKGGLRLYESEAATV